MKSFNRRRLLKSGASMITGMASIGSGISLTSAASSNKKTMSYKRIATEECFVLPEYTSAVSNFMKKNPGAEPSESWLSKGFPPVERLPCGKRIQDFAIRIDEMDRDGIDHQVLSLMQPGVQIFDADTGSEISTLINDKITSISKGYPGRFSNLATIAPQAPAAAANELKRAVKKLGMKGALLNSHTKGKYIDDSSLWPIYETAETLDVPIYIHPRNPSPQMIKPYQGYGLHTILGFAAEASLNAMRLILSGAFDDFPKLQIVLGHLGEGIPFCLDRIDNRYAYIPAKYKNKYRKLKLKPSEYFIKNFVVTSSGQNWSPAVKFCQQVLGSDKVLFAVDYPWEDQKETVAAADEIEMSKADQKKFFEDNARRIFNISNMP